MAWNPTQYRLFGSERQRPALDLLARVRCEAPVRIADLGCGTGEITRLLAERWPAAAVSGVDDSEEMLAEATRRADGISWERASLEAWSPPEPVDLIFSNAALHWLDDHPASFRRLAGLVAPGGCLAVQMPRNHGEPSHTLARAVAEEGTWSKRLRPFPGPAPVGTAGDYYRLLSPLARSLDIWETTYLQVLSGENPVAEWTRGTLLLPLLDALDEEDWPRFEAEYRRRVRLAYPPQADGKTLFPFRRLFLVAEL